jgi:transcriptional regulator with XRE-family HTH domain
MLYEARYNKLREELATVRIHAGMTQSQLAKRLGKAQSFVSKVETGERYLDVLEFLRWCEAADADACRVLLVIQRVPAAES